VFKRFAMVLLLCSLAAQATAKDKIKDKEKDQDKVAVTLTAPAAHSSATAPATITVTADASAKQSNHPVVQVDFFAGATLIGSASTPPYTITWRNVSAGNYVLSAQAINDKGDRATSEPVPINVNAPPSVTLTAPATGASYTGPADIALSADATDSDGSIAKVDFFHGTTLIGSAASAPYSMTWSTVAPGNYSITAVATDNQGAATSSGILHINVNARPTVALTAPNTGTRYTAPATIALHANAADSDGTIAKVDFFQGTILLGTAATAPYSVSWTNVAAGLYTITAVATDNQGAVGTTAALVVNVNAPPSVALTAPGNNASYIAPATILLTASASDTDGSIASVTFRHGSTVLATVTQAPYQFAWTDAVPGTYPLTATATDNQGATTSSVSVTVTVVANQLPSVALTAPVNNQSFVAPASLLLNASASDADGTIAHVAFYAGATLVGTVLEAPYMFHWTNVSQGSYTLTAKAIDNLGGQTISAPVTIAVVANTPPSISITGTASGPMAPASITLVAQAGDADGSIAQVAFFNGNTLLGTVTQAPYGFVWNDVGAGTYALSAKATDNAGATTTSAAVTVTLAEKAAGLAKVYFIETDHLNTPRRITDATNQVVWQWDNNDPFGNNVPVANAGFEFNLRFPGQYFDKETNLHYNYYRTYDPATGRYIESDPIGLDGGLNTYTYVDNDPLGYIDPEGLVKFPSFGKKPPGMKPPRWSPNRPGEGKPKYKPNPAHDPKSSQYNPNKTPEPKDCPEVYKKAVPDDPYNPRHWWGRNEKGEFYRYHNSNDGTTHYSGTYDAKHSHVPPYVRSRLGY